MTEGSPDDAAADRVVGLVLAAGEGRRMGRPKGLLVGAGDHSLARIAVDALRAGGCRTVVLVVGAQGDAVRATVPPADGVRVVVAADWAEGMGASLRAGLAAVTGAAADAVLVTLVDTPEVDAAVVRRLVAHASPTALARAAYGGRPGHPVLIGREHWAAVAAVASGDRGARDYLAAREVTLVDCTDLGSGVDLDTPDDVARYEREISGRSRSPRRTPG